MAKVIMVQGSMSGVGKSLIVAGLCRVFRRMGYRVAPFKSQNMALNSYITSQGLEMGRAQVMQAEAAGIEPDVCMNPILLKPTNHVGSQVIVNGEVLGNMNARDYFAYKKKLIPDILTAFHKLEEMADIIVIEGAGSPAEINLKENDIVNMGLAELVDAPVILVGDIDRGGVFAQLLGTLNLLTPAENSRVKGLIINKFRGDASILSPGISSLEEKGGIPVVGVLPYMQLQLEDEDSLSERFEASGKGELDIAVIKLPRISNFSDFNVFEQFKSVSLRYIQHPSELGNPDLIILPGSKNTMGDLKWLYRTGFAEQIVKRSSEIPIWGICGGYQMLGQSIEDPYGVEEGGMIKGLHLLPVCTILDSRKTRKQVYGNLSGIQGIFHNLSGVPYEGYEIHMGQTDGTVDCTAPVCNVGNVYGTYVHGIFDKAEVCTEILNALASLSGNHIEEYKALDYKAIKEREFERLADMIEDNLDMDCILKMMEEQEIAIEPVTIQSILQNPDLKLPDPKVIGLVKSNWDHIAKPLDSMGVFESLSARIGGILRDPSLQLNRKSVIVMCADNGVVDEGISQSGREVTLAVTKSICNGTSSVARLASHVGMNVYAVDMGIDTDEEISGVINRKIRKGTRNFVLKPAMTREEVLSAINVGIEIIRQRKIMGDQLIAVGEMGIGNTTTASAVCAALLKVDPALITGRGAGLDDNKLLKKKQVISDALSKYNLAKQDALTILQTVGGLDIAGMVGLMIGGAYYGIPIVLDGVISQAAALTAVRMVPAVEHYLIPSHEGKEPASKWLLEALHMEGVIRGELALGEGTGAVMMCELLSTALSLYCGNTSFEQMGIDAYKRFV